MPVDTRCVCGNASCRQGSACGTYPSNIRSPEGYNRPSVATQQTHHEAGGQHQSFTTPLVLQDARHPDGTAMGISDGRNGIAGLNNQGSPYAAGNDHSATVPSSVNVQPSTLPAPIVQDHHENLRIASYPDPVIQNLHANTQIPGYQNPVVQNLYENPQLTGYLNPSVTNGTSSQVSISQPYSLLAQNQDLHDPSPNPHNNEASYSQYESAIPPTGLSASQTYFPCAATMASASMQSYTPFVTQAGLQHDQIRPLHFNQTDNHQEEPPDSLLSSFESQDASQRSLPSPYYRNPRNWPHPTAFSPGDLHPSQPEPYFVGPNAQQTQTSQHQSDSHATSFLTASHMFPQAPDGSVSTNFPSYYSNVQQLSGIPMFPQASGSLPPTSGHLYNPDTQQFGGNQMPPQAPGSLNPTSDPPSPSPSDSDTEQSSTNQVSPSMASIYDSTQKYPYAPSGYPGLCRHSDCSRDVRSYTTEKKWETHNNQKHVKSYVCGCNGCDMRFRLKADRERHRNEVHKRFKKYWCEIANCKADVKSFYRRYMLTNHNKIWHGPSPCGKPNCPRGAGHGFKDQKTLDWHSAHLCEMRDVGCD
jgi:hypothetical protein